VLVVQWLKAHPRFLKNPLYIMGDSYAGIILPILVQQISDGIYIYMNITFLIHASIFQKKKRKEKIDVIYNDGRIQFTQAIAT
jgi:carboxypeptidase C (cathepsin A)